jgi:hypothetical protein
MSHTITAFHVLALALSKPGDSGGPSKLEDVARSVGFQFVANSPNPLPDVLPDNIYEFESRNLKKPHNGPLLRTTFNFHHRPAEELVLFWDGRVYSKPLGADDSEATDVSFSSSLETK